MTSSEGEGRGGWTSEGDDGVACSKVTTANGGHVGEGSCRSAGRQRRSVVELEDAPWRREPLASGELHGTMDNVQHERERNGEKEEGVKCASDGLSWSPGCDLLVEIL
ncbi:hypothetical protein ZWY2020_040649 [Hordeum vulgare]|nr:hypothetical protein ZWY2020_040649 [Hordeum vulgare]